MASHAGNPPDLLSRIHGPHSLAGDYGVEGLSGQSRGNAETTVVIPIGGRAIETERTPEAIHIVAKK